MMKRLLGLFLLIALTTPPGARAQGGDLNMNGIASFEQLRLEYYIGALYLGWPGHSPDAIANMPGRKRMELHITVDHWPTLRFAQMWNQLITINSPGKVLNANANDMLGFTSMLKGELVAGDILAIELTDHNTTLVTLNDVPMLHTDSPALFDMLLNTWIGQRPPSTEFKRDMLDIAQAPGASALVARYNAIAPNEARKKFVTAWEEKRAPEHEAATEIATATVSATSKSHEAAVEKEKEAKEKETAAAKEAVKTAEADKAKAAQKAAAAAAESAEAIAARKAHEATEKAEQARQSQLYDDYLLTVRRDIVRNVDYPRRAQKDNIEGLVMLRVRIDRNGGLASYEVAQSADDLLDGAAIKAVKKAAPFAKPSDELKGNVFEFLIPMVFKLSQ